MAVFRMLPLWRKLVLFLASGWLASHPALGAGDPRRVDGACTVELEPEGAPPFTVTLIRSTEGGEALWLREPGRFHVADTQIDLQLPRERWVDIGNGAVALNGLYEVTLRAVSDGTLVVTRIDMIDKRIVEAVASGDGLLFGGIGLVGRTPYRFRLHGGAATYAALRRCTEAGGGRTTSVAGRPGAVEIPLTGEASGTHTLQGTVNGTTPLTFLLDTGASFVMIPRGVADALMADGTLTPADYVGTVASVLADGRQLSQPLYLLRSITVGGRTVTDVQCVVGNDDQTSLLLGQSFLHKFRSYSIDHVRSVLVLGP